MRTAIITDSNSGVSQEEGKALGIYVLPMPFMIDEETKFDGLDLTNQEFYARQEADADVSTSQPSPESVMNLWDEGLKEYDEVVYIPMSSGLSGSCETAIMLSRDYEGKVQVVNNQRISVTQRQSVLDAMELAKAGKNAAQIKEILERVKSESIIYVMVDTLKYLKKGGRITPAAAALGTLLKLKPVLTIQGDKLDAFAKARTIKQAKNIMITAIQKDLTERFGDTRCQDTYMQVAHSKNTEAAEELRAELQELFPETDIYVADLSLSIACHIGPGALAIACTKKVHID